MRRLARITPPRFAFISWIPALALTSCDPIINIAGANFPAWMLCALIGAASLPILRVLLLQTGIDQWLWWAPGVYASAAILIACIVWTVFFNRI
jgi:hypothetical protein